MPPYDSSLEDIKDRIDIVELISDYVHLKKAGQNWKGLCPFHAEKTPSFTVSPAKQIYHCFGCGNGGDIFTFLVRYENISFPEALGMLAKKAGVTLKASKKDAVKTGEKETLLNIHRDAQGFFRGNLPGSHKALAYLDGRGMDGEAQERFALGYAPKSWNALLNFLSGKGHSHEMIKKAGLAVQGTKGHYDTFRDRIIFPIHDLKGDVIAFGGRSIDGSEPKYLNSPETLIFNKRRVLYGLLHAKDSIKQDGNALFMEGYLDVITAHMSGFKNSVAPLGTALTPEHGKLIKRFTEDAVLVFDSDQAGIKAAGNAANILFGSGLNVTVLTFPENEDPDSFLRKKGSEAFAKLLRSPLNIIDFYMSKKGDRRLKAREALETISRVTDRILQGDYIRMLSERLNVRESLVMEQLKKVSMRPSGAHKENVPKAPPGPGRRPADEVYIIKLLMQVPERSEEICSMISADDFRDPATAGIYMKIKENGADLEELLGICEGEQKDLLTEISLKDDFENPEKVLEDCIKRLGDNKRKILLHELQLKIREAEQQKDFKLLKQLQMEQQKVLMPGKKR